MPHYSNYEPYKYTLFKFREQEKRRKLTHYNNQQLNALQLVTYAVSYTPWNQISIHNFSLLEHCPLLCTTQTKERNKEKEKEKKKEKEKDEEKK